MTQIQKFELEDGAVELLPQFLTPQQARNCYQRLNTELEWQEEWIKIAGRSVKVPRLVSWYGDPNAYYRYSGVEHMPRAWTPLLQELKTAVEAACNRPFNSVLANFYRNERDSMGWHADREPELGYDPFIASLSFGAERLFKLRHNKSGRNVDLVLPDGSLLIMHGALQHHWKHCLPKLRQPTGPRINLTFRAVQPHR